MACCKIAGPGVEPPGRSQEASVASPTVTGIAGDDPIDGIADDLRERDVPAACLGSEAAHLVRGERDLRSDHGPMLSPGTMRYHL